MRIVQTGEPAGLMRALHIGWGVVHEKGPLGLQLELSGHGL